tara:strand:- start:172 stop:501 length:330 start_codon:yes stop_codon:yes gene_type:complete
MGMMKSLMIDFLETIKLPDEAWDALECDHTRAKMYKAAYAYSEFIEAVENNKSPTTCVGREVARLQLDTIVYCRKRDNKKWFWPYVRISLAARTNLDSKSLHRCKEQIQ